MNDSDDPWANGHTIETLRAVAATITPTVEDYVAQPVVVGGVEAEWISTDGFAAHAPAILYLHGGAYLCGHPADYRNMTVWLSRLTGVQVLALDYRLAPEHPFPAAMEDAFSAYKWLLDEGYGAIAVAGDSAGAALAVTLAADARDAQLPLPSCVLGNSPYADLSLQSPSLNDPARNTAQPNKTTIEWLAETYIDAGDIRQEPADPRISPVFRDLNGLPPMLIQTGGLDNLQDDGERLALRAQDCGVSCQLTEYPEAPHIWPVLVPADDSDQSHRALREMADFLKASLLGA